MEISRRRFLLTGLAGAAAACSSEPSGQTPESAQATTDSTASTTNAPTTTTIPSIRPVDAPAYEGSPPFSLGVASGDPDDRSVVLWTRLLSDAELPEQVAVDVATDAAFDDLVYSGLHDAPGSHANTVHALIDTLDADSWYHYRFRVGSEVSPVGRTRTLPTTGTGEVRFAFSSCQNWEQGTYAAHRHLAETDVDFFVWLGDYIYEYGPNDQGVVGSAGPRVHNSGEVTELQAYRDRYALYRSDLNLQAHHASHPWFVTWDDHEVDNNHAGLATEDGQDETAFLQRRTEAHQAWWEHMPVRMPPPVAGQPFVIYRSARWGDLLDLRILDGRQFRDAQPTDGEPVEIAAAANLGVQTLGATAQSEDQSLLGFEQRAWLLDAVAASTSNWTVLANQIYMHGLNALPGDVPTINPDSWDGYFGERRLLLEAIAQAQSDVVVLTGDFHAASVGDLRPDPFDFSTPVVATEFMAPAISSRFPDQLRSLAPLVLGLNPQVRHFDPANGFMLCAVSADRWQTTLHTLADATDEGSALAVAGTFTVERGAAGVATIEIPSES